jgi:hypothetical protein
MATSLAAFFSSPSALVPIITAVLNVVTIFALSASGRFRADRWWLAGGLFALNALLAMAVVEAPEGGDAVSWDLVLSAFTGRWVLTFAIGAILWRRMAPSYIPEHWLEPEDSFE